MDANLASTHFLSLPRPDVLAGPPAGVPDTTTLAAHDFDVDTRTGFMPPHAPLSRLPEPWESWEATLDEARSLQLKLGDTPDLPEDELVKSETWRSHVRNLAVLPITELKKSELYLRRAHHVLGFIMHFYIHSLPADAPVVIPSPVALPLLQISAQLRLPPVLTYSDNVLYNWDLKLAPSTMDNVPTVDNLRSQTLFTEATDEEEFYLTSSRIELKGVDALELMQVIMDEAFVGDDIAIRRITQYLQNLAAVIQDLRATLLTVRETCNPDIFYHLIRPWFRGVDSDPRQRPWMFEGIEQDPTLEVPTELSGPSAGQSSLIHALDIFLGVDQYSHSSSLTGSSASGTGKTAFLDRMQSYMPRHHRMFLNHLSANPRPLRGVVSSSNDPGLLEAYNAAVLALKEFRDAHMIIVAVYIFGPSKRPPPPSAITKQVRPNFKKDYGVDALKGTGGTELAMFLKDVRDRTAGAVLPST